MQKKSDLRFFRESHGYTQDSLAKALNISRNYVYLVEAGKKPLSNKLQRKLEMLERLGDHHETGPPSSSVVRAAHQPYDFSKIEASHLAIMERLDAVETDLALIKKLLSK